MHQLDRNPLRSGIVCEGREFLGMDIRKPNLGEGIPGHKTPGTLLAQFYLGFYLPARPNVLIAGRACVPYAQAGPKTIMR